MGDAFAQDDRKKGLLPRTKTRARRAVKYCLLTALIFCSFLVGVRFERWGGLDRLMPAVIDTVREKALGDNATLDLERFFCGLQDSWRRRGRRSKTTPSRVADPSGATAGKNANSATTATAPRIAPGEATTPTAPVVAAAPTSATARTAIPDSPTTPILALPATAPTRPFDAAATSSPSTAPPPRPTPSALPASTPTVAPTSTPTAEPTPTPTPAPLALPTRSSDNPTTRSSDNPASGPPTSGKEGVWEESDVSEKTGRALCARTFFRPDPERDYAVVYVYKFDLERLRLEFVPGKDPDRGLPGRMDSRQEERVAWVFNGGFQYRHGNYGTKYNHTVLNPPRPQVATVVLAADGACDILAWPENETSAPLVPTFRQNEIPLIVDGALSPKIDKMWGYTPKKQDPIYTERSALGFTDDNELVFAMGKPLSARTLAQAMLKAGVRKAIHLDMNHYNVHLLRAKRNDAGTLSTLNENKMCSWYPRLYLDPSERDFFILTRRE